MSKETSSGIPPKTLQTVRDLQQHNRHVYFIRSSAKQITPTIHVDVTGEGRITFSAGCYWIDVNSFEIG